IQRGFVSRVALNWGAMELSRPLVVAFPLSQKRKAIVADALAGASAVVYLTELDEMARTDALRNTGVFLTFNTSKELRPGEAKLLDGARLIHGRCARGDQRWRLRRVDDRARSRHGTGRRQASGLGARKRQTWPV